VICAQAFVQQDFIAQLEQQNLLHVKMACIPQLQPMSASNALGSWALDKVLMCCHKDAETQGNVVHIEFICGGPAFFSLKKYYH